MATIITSDKHVGVFALAYAVPSPLPYAASVRWQPAAMGERAAAGRRALLLSALAVLRHCETPSAAGDSGAIANAFGQGSSLSGAPPG